MIPPDSQGDQIDDQEEESGDPIEAPSTRIAPENSVSVGSSLGPKVSGAGHAGRVPQGGFFHKNPRNPDNRMDVLKLFKRSTKAGKRPKSSKNPLSGAFTVWPAPETLGLPTDTPNCPQHKHNTSTTQASSGVATTPNPSVGVARRLPRRALSARGNCGTCSARARSWGTASFSRGTKHANCA